MGAAAGLWRVRDRSTFDDLRRRGVRRRSGPVTLTWAPDQAGAGDPPRVAYAIGRPLGTAVARNRLRRRLRAVMATLAPSIPPGAYLVSASPRAATMPFDDLVAATRRAVEALPGEVRS